MRDAHRVKVAIFFQWRGNPTPYAWLRSPGASSTRCSSRWAYCSWTTPLFGVAHIFASFNGTIAHVTDLSGRETIVRVTGGMKVEADRDESSPYAAMLAAQDVAARCKEFGITALHTKLCATGGTNQRTPGLGAQAALRALARARMRIGGIEDVAPIPTGSTRRGHGRHGRCL